MLRGHFDAPFYFQALLKPLAVLINHGVNDVDKGFIAVEHAVPTGEYVAFEPTLDRMLTEHLHDAPLECEIPAIGILVEIFTQPYLLTSLVYITQLVRFRLIRTEDAESVLIQPDDIS